MKITTCMTFHANRGSKGTAKNSRVYVDGEPTEIILVEETSGRSAGYRYTARELHFGDEVLDLLKPSASGVTVESWIAERIRKSESSNWEH